MLNEANIINRIKNNFPDYIGDDAAVIPLSDTQSYVITKDVLVEDQHFRRRYFDPDSLAHKVLHSNLSDIAAMGARPQFMLLGLALPKSYSNDINIFLDKLSELCIKNNVIIIGGDTVAASDSLFISVTLIGVAETDNIKYRHTAQVGDLICVLGDMGHASVGFSAFEKNVTGLDSYKKRFLTPCAYVEEGQFLGEELSVTSMMDVSDGIWVDLSRLCQASNVGAEINLDGFPQTDLYQAACHQLQLDPALTQLEGGEDYSLLLTIKQGEYSSLAKKIKQQFSLGLTCIGVIKDGKGVDVIKNQALVSLNLKPFSHFGEGL